jgi:hypothetical protein
VIPPRHGLSHRQQRSRQRPRRSARLTRAGVVVLHRDIREPNDNGARGTGRNRIGTRRGRIRDRRGDLHRSRGIPVGAQHRDAPIPAPHPIRVSPWPPSRTSPVGAVATRWRGRPRSSKGSRRGTSTVSRLRPSRDLDAENRSYNALLTAVRAIGERANAELKQRWLCLRRIRRCPQPSGAAS